MLPQYNCNIKGRRHFTSVYIS